MKHPGYYISIATAILILAASIYGLLSSSYQELLTRQLCLLIAAIMVTGISINILMYTWRLNHHQSSNNH